MIAMRVSKLEVLFQRVLMLMYASADRRKCIVNKY